MVAAQVKPLLLDAAGRSVWRGTLAQVAPLKSLGYRTFAFAPNV
jgi:hypothetical protein